MKKMKKYSMADLIKINPDDHVLNNPFMYWGTDNPSSIDFINGVKNQLGFLNYQKIKSLTANDWYFIGSKFDWIQSGIINRDSENDLFNRVFGFTNSDGAIGVRVEYFIKIYTDHVSLWRNNKINKIKGDIDNEVIEFIKENYNNYFTLAFKVDKEL
jgi:hypothetical protein